MTHRLTYLQHTVKSIRTTRLRDHVLVSRTPTAPLTSQSCSGFMEQAQAFTSLAG
jgi:hypothetical protein